MHAMLLMFVLAQPPWSNDVEVRFKVADESGCPVSNAVVRVFTRRDLIPSFSHGGDPQRTVEVMTDANGIAEVKFPCYSSVFNCDVKANGYYYEKMMDVVFKHSSKGAIFSEHLLEHSKKIDFVLRRVLCPVPGYGYGALDCISYPQPTGKFGFDMEVGEWLPPHGRGKCADFWIVSETSMEPTGELRRVGVEFVGAYNGAYKSKKKKATMFKSDYTVDVAKNFSPRILLWSKLITGKEYSIWRFVSDDEYLVIRSRSVVSPRGELLSCNYSKIYGPISCGGALCFEEMFFNPKVNDRNLEFDPQHNLKKKIVSGFVRP